MTSTHENLSHLPESKRPDYTPATAADSVSQALRLLEGRWKLSILFQLFGGQVRRFSELERGLPGVSQKMLIQQLRQLESDGIVARTVYPEVPPRVEYRLTEWGQAYFNWPTDRITLARTVDALDSVTKRGTKITFFRLGDDPGLVSLIDALANRTGANVVAPDLNELGGAVVGQYLRW